MYHSDHVHLLYELQSFQQLWNNPFLLNMQGYSLFSGYISPISSAFSLARESESSNTSTHGEEAFAFVKFPSLLLLQTLYTRLDKDYLTPVQQLN